MSKNFHGNFMSIKTDVAIVRDLVNKTTYTVCATSYTKQTLLSCCVIVDRMSEAVSCILSAIPRNIVPPDKTAFAEERSTRFTESTRLINSFKSKVDLAQERVASKTSWLCQTKLHSLC